MSRDTQNPPSDGPTLRPGTRVGAVVSTYHAELTGAMLRSARAELEGAGLAAEDLLVLDAPGAFELPLIARRLAVREDVDAVMCFGLVLRGETSHDQHIASAVSQALQRVAFETDKPILFGVLTCNDLDQARARALPPAEGGVHDKGREVAQAAVGAIDAMRRAAEVGRAASAMGFGNAGSGR